MAMLQFGWNFIRACDFVDYYIIYKFVIHRRSLRTDQNLLGLILMSLQKISSIIIFIFRSSVFPLRCGLQVSPLGPIILGCRLTRPLENALCLLRIIHLMEMFINGWECLLLLSLMQPLMFCWKLFKGMKNLQPSKLTYKISLLAAYKQNVNKTFNLLTLTFPLNQND